MRIAFLTERMLVGFGVDLYVDQVAARLQRRGHEVTIYCAQIDERARTGGYRLERLPIEAARFYPLYEKRAKAWTGSIDAAHHDVIFVETFPFYALIPGLATPVIAVDHGTSSSEGMSAARRAMFAYTEYAKQHMFLPHAEGILTISEFIRRSMPPRSRDRARVVYAGSDHYPLPPEHTRDVVRSRLGIRNGEIMALYVGRLNPKRQPYKGTSDLLALAPRWRAHGIRLVMAGRAEEGDPARIDAAEAILAREPPPDELAGLYAAADIFVTASRWEGFDLPLAEAAYAGVPGVAFRIGAHPEVAVDGTTATLVDSPQEMDDAVQALAADTDRRHRMGRAAAERAREMFTWERVTSAHEEAARAAVRSTSGEHTQDVTAVVLNYGAPFETLDRCLASIQAQTYPTSTILVDNASAENREALDKVIEAHPAVRRIDLPRNLGFAGGMNRGLAEVRSEFVLVLNNDTELEPDAVKHMVAVLDGEPSAAGVAPKIVFADDPHVFDAIGSLITPSGSAFNRGIGQIDVGQYDRTEATFGLCFAGALIRTALFRADQVGRLDERYFMYYEDVDWCYRANLLGYTFLTAPRAVVRHQHSLSTRKLGYPFKYRLIERNFVRTIIKCFEPRRAAYYALRRAVVQLRNALARRIYPLDSLRVMLETVRDIPWLVRERRRIQPRRRVPDRLIVAYAADERPLFDPVRYEPVATFDTIYEMYRRLARLTGDPHAAAIAEAARTAPTTPGQRTELGRLLRGEPERVRALYEEIERPTPA